MTNFEKFEKEIMEVLRNSNTIAVINNKPTQCGLVKRCNECFFHSRCCQFELFKWLYSEYKERPKLTKQERKFCEMLEGKDCWFARDLNEELCLFVNKPRREDGEDMWWANTTGVAIMAGDDFVVFEIEMSFIKWEDEEPWSVEELLKLEVEE